MRNEETHTYRSMLNIRNDRGRMKNLQKVLEVWGCSEVAPMDLYTNIFRLGDGLIQKRGEPSGLYKTNPIIVGHNGSFPVKRIMFEDEFESLLTEFQGYEWAILNGVTYWGRNNLAANQSKMYAMIFDLDGVTEKTLGSFMDGVSADYYPQPNYITLSGHGVHLYYVFEQPISLYPNIKTQLKQLKYALTRVIWNERTSTDRNVQCQGINQGYRIVGGKTKVKNVAVRAFEVDSHPVTLDYLNEFVDDKNKIDVSRLYRESRMSLPEAQEKYPEWYERCIVNKEPPGTWKTSRKVYEWWKTKIFDSAVYGHRYYCLMALAIFAIKCDVREEELRKDALSFVKMLNALHPEDPFLESDAESALDCFDERYITFPRSSLEALTGIPMPENKRNHQDRMTHLHADYWEIDGETVENECRKNREAALEKAREEGRITGRPEGSGTKKDLVRDYYAEHPESSLRKAATDLGISKNTVRKWKR